MVFSNHLLKIFKLLGEDKIEHSLKEIYFLSKKINDLYSKKLLRKKLQIINEDYRILNEEYNLNKISYEDYNVRRNQIINAILELLREIEIQYNKNTSSIQYNIAIAETGKAILELLTITKGTDLHNEAILLSSRHFTLEKDFHSGIIDANELDELKLAISTIFSSFK